LLVVRQPRCARRRDLGYFATARQGLDAEHARASRGVSPDKQDKIVLADRTADLAWIPTDPVLPNGWRQKTAVIPDAFKQ
jgi:hypothetical protein